MTREEAIKMIEDDKKRHHDELSGRYRAALTMAIEALQQEPIIHCKDCEYAKPFLDRYHCKQLDEDWEISFEAEHYCSYAERMESDKSLTKLSKEQTKREGK